MKIAWFTPFSRNSAIGCYSKLACEALKKYHDVTIYANNSEDLLQSSVNVENFKGKDIVKQLSDYDEVFYNLGDNSHFHAEIFEVASNFSGVIILHDVTYLNFITNYYIHYLNQQDEYKKLISQYYGEDASNTILNAVNSFEDWNNIDFLYYNCLDIVTKKAKGAIVHSYYHKTILSKSYFGPIHVLYFPYISKPSKTLVRKKSGKYLQLLTVGNVNHNKRIAQIIKAIGGDEKLRSNIKYTVAGRLDNGSYEKKLRELIKENKLENSIYLEGPVSVERLDSLYEEAEVIANLRNPAIEGASWSLVEQMDIAKPIIVTNIGFYSEIPDVCLVKLVDDADSEIENIRKVLLWIMDNLEEANKIAQKAKEYLHKNFSPDNYTKGFEEFLDHLAFLEPIEELMDQLIFEMAFAGITSDLQICSTVSEEMEKMFSGHKALSDKTNAEVINAENKHTFSQ